jgi:hypothetical protein
MNRDYSSGVADDITFFIGNEVEHTPAYGMKTLFVTGVQDELIIESLIHNNNCQHIFFGANHSFNPAFNDYDGWKEWDDMITFFLNKGY